MEALGAGILLAGCPSLASASSRAFSALKNKPTQVILSPDRSVYKSGTPRIVWVRRGSDEFLIDVYIPSGYQALAWLSRDIRAGDIIGTPDARLVRQLVWIQGKLVRLGYDQPLVMTSGLRMPLTNQATEDAARNSFHLPKDDPMANIKRQFGAFDLEIPGVPSSTLASVALMARDGGVGFYGDDRHVHMDIGRIRFWTAG